MLTNISDDDKARLWTLLQITDAIRDADEYDLPEGETIPLTEAYLFDLAKRTVDEAPDWDAQEFTHQLANREEVITALKHGDELRLEMVTKLHDTMSKVLVEWETKFPECETLGEVAAASRAAGRA